MAKQNQRLEALTKGLFWLTVVIAVLTAVLVVIELGWLRPIIGH